MTDITFEELWAAVTSEIERVYGIASDNLGIPGGRIAGYYQLGESPYRVALDIGAERGLRPA